MLLSFHGVQFMTSLMLGQIVRLRQVCNAQGVTLKLCDVEADLRTIFKTIQLHTLVQIGDDEQTVLASFESSDIGAAAHNALTTADDHRAAAALSVLVQLSAHAQVLVFTHHQRLARQAEELRGAVTVHRL